MKYFDQDEPPEIPSDLFVCPICGAQVEFSEINEYEADTGKVTNTGFRVTCTTEPDFDDPDFNEWMLGHFSLDWMPLEMKIYQWLSMNYRVKQ